MDGRDGRARPSRPDPYPWDWLRAAVILEGLPRPAWLPQKKSAASWGEPRRLKANTGERCPQRLGENLTRGIKQAACQCVRLYNSETYGCGRTAGARELTEIVSP